MNQRLTLCFALLGVALAISPEVLAQPQTSSVSASDVEAARAKFEAGAGAYRAERYQEAIEAFLAADALAPRPALSFNIARAYDKLGDDVRALEYYRQYLERDPNGETAEETRARIVELEAALAARGVATPPPAPATPLPAATPEPPPLATKPVAKPAAPAQAPAPEARFEMGAFGVWPWVLLGAGGAAVATSLGFELARRSAEGDAETASHAEFQDKYDAMERRKVTARVFAGVGGALLIAGGVLVYFDRQTRDAVAFDCGPARCAAQWEHRF